MGLPDLAVKESRDRVKAAIKNAGFDFPARRITVNLAPADIKKEGVAFDLPIAVGILAAMESVRPDALRRYAILGELSLDGGIRPIRGVLPMAVEVKAAGLKGLVVPEDNAPEAAVVEGLDPWCRCVPGRRQIRSRLPPFLSRATHGTECRSCNNRGK